jgi:hypothetical protein
MAGEGHGIAMVNSRRRSFMLTACFTASSASGTNMADSSVHSKWNMEPALKKAGMATDG